MQASVAAGLLTGRRAEGAPVLPFVHFIDGKGHSPSIEYRREEAKTHGSNELEPIWVCLCDPWAVRGGLCAFALYGWVGGSVSTPCLCASEVYGPSPQLSTATHVAEVAGGARVLLEVALVVFLGPPEERCRLDQRDHRA